MSASLPIGVRPAWRALLPGVAVAALLGGMAYLLALGWPLLFPRPLLSAAAPADCELGRGPCTAVFDDGGFIRLSIPVQALAANAPLQVIVESGGLEAGSATIEFSGVDMNMGMIRQPLTPAGGDSFAGEAVLPVCIRRRMTWQAQVNLSGPQADYRGLFRFEVERR